MKADTYELKGILGKERIFVIPTFQRDYEWTRQGQWELLFQDLDALAERLYIARHGNSVQGGSVSSPPESGVAPHFLGAIVCDQVSTSTGDIDTRAVIDGQQRLTTLQLLIRGLLDVLQESGSSRAARVRRLLNNPEDIVSREHPEHRYKLWPRRKDREIWPMAVGDELPSADAKHPYIEARRFFAGQIRAAKEAPDGSDRLDEITDALLDLFKIVVIDLDENDDAQVIFEVLNGRQTPLSASDLVKNLLFLRAERALEDVEELYDRYWTDFDRSWWKVQVGTGHAARERRDVLLSVWLTAASGETASVAHLYGEIRRYLDITDSKPKDVLRELHEYGQAYHAIYSGTAATTQRICDAYSRLIRLNVTTAMPLLVWLITLDSTQLNAVAHERAVLAVESWVVRRMLRGANTRGYGSAFLNVLKAARSAEQRGGDIGDAIIDALDTSSLAMGWPGDAELTQIFKDKPLYRDLSQERVRMLLGAVDKDMQARNHTDPEAFFDYDRLQIEHVMPQQWRPSWPMSADATKETEYLRDIAVHTVGNLTLVTPTFNQAVSNGPWSAKRPEFINQTKLEINRDIGGIDDWNEAAIAARGAALASATADVWLAPERLRSAQFQERADWAAPPVAGPRGRTVRSEGGTEGGGESAGVPPRVDAANISWSPAGRASDMLHRADGARYKIGTGRTGTYEWVVKDGLWAAYFRPGDVQTQTPVELLAPQSSEGKAYRACVDHNNATP